uniref:Uroplakin 3B n=1 Tax=Varanus komodoensis TaxID=61221 RepID=A0A8D2IU20_VARKO
VTAARAGRVPPHPLFLADSHWLSCWLSPDVNYKPRLTSEKVAGRITASTFVLEQPRCIFNEVVKPTDNVWLVVALSEAEDELPIPLSARELPYQSFGSNSSYMTLKTPVTNYPCPDPGEASEALTVLRVGSETGCITDLSWPDCNGPLPGPGPYKVKFVAMNSTQITAQSHWSDLITLRKGKDPNSINTQPARRSAGMIVITSVLSILFAILLAALITALPRRSPEPQRPGASFRLSPALLLADCHSHHSGPAMGVVLVGNLKTSKSPPLFAVRVKANTWDFAIHTVTKMCRISGSPSLLRK